MPGLLPVLSFISYFLWNLDVTGWIVSSPKVCGSPSFPYLSMWPYLEVVFADVIKLKCGLIRVDLNPLWLVFLSEEENSDTDTHTEEDVMWWHRHRGETGSWRWRQRVEWRGCKPRNAWGCHRLHQARQDSPLETLERARPCRHLDFGLLASRTWQNTFLSCKPPRLWCIATAALANSDIWCIWGFPTQANCQTSIPQLVREFSGSSQARLCGSVRHYWSWISAFVTATQIPLGNCFRLYVSKFEDQPSKDSPSSGKGGWMVFQAQLEGAWV